MKINQFLRALSIILLYFSLSFFPFTKAYAEKANPCESPITEREKLICAELIELDKFAYETASELKRRNDKIQKAYESAVIARYKHLEELYLLTQNAFKEQQSLIPKFFWLTIAVVGLGIALTIIQFYWAGKFDSSQLETEFKSDGKSLKLKTQVIGIIILVISASFVFFFYTFVYSIDVLPLNSVKPQSLSEVISEQK